MPEAPARVPISCSDPRVRIPVHVVRSADAVRSAAPPPCDPKDPACPAFWATSTTASSADAQRTQSSHIISDSSSSSGPVRIPIRVVPSAEQGARSIDISSSSSVAPTPAALAHAHSAAPSIIYTQPNPVRIPVTVRAAPGADSSAPPRTQYKIPVRRAGEEQRARASPGTCAPAKPLQKSVRDDFNTVYRHMLQHPDVYEVVPNAGGGDCFFASVAQALQPHYPEIQAEDIRSAFADSLTQEDLELYEMKATALAGTDDEGSMEWFEGTKDLADLKHRVIQSSFWADDLCVGRISLLFDLRFVVLVVDAGYIACGAVPDGVSGCHFVLLLRSGNEMCGHFQLITVDGEGILSGLPPIVQQYVQQHCKQEYGRGNWPACPRHAREILLPPQLEERLFNEHRL